MKWWPFNRRKPKFDTVFVEVILLQWPWADDDPEVQDLGSLDNLLEGVLLPDGLGQWTGHGQMLDGSYYNFDFEILPVNLATGIAALRKELLRLQAAPSSYIQTGDPDNKIYELATGASRPRPDPR